MTKYLIIMWSSLILLPVLAQAVPATTCAELVKLTRQEIASGGATRAAVLDCKGRGDIPLHLRSRMGEVPIVTPVGNSHPGAPCRPGVKQQCPNNLRKYTDGSESPKGYDPAVNPNLNIPELPWGELDDREIPCGALATFAQSALQSLLGKAKINIPTPVGEINDIIGQISGKMNQLRSLISQIQAGQNIPNNQVNSTIGDISSEVSTALRKMPLVGGALKGLINTGLNLLKQKSNELINKKATAPRAEIDKIVAEINKHMGTVNGYLNTARSEVAKAQKKVDDAEKGLLGDLDLKGEINKGITGLLGNIFKYKNCQGGQFWGILNNLFTLVMSKRKHAYDVSNSTFISPDDSYVTLPLNATISVVPQTSRPAVPFSLPNGGSFIDGKGYNVTLNKGVTPKFRSDGVITVSDGNQFRVDPRQELVLNPNGIIGIPPKTRVPVPRDGKVYPVAPITKPPAWFNEDYANSAK